MGFAISFRSDHPSAEPVRALWRQVEGFEDAPSMALLGYPPHVTLAIYDDDAVGEELVKDALERAGRDLKALTLTFDAIRIFEGSPMVLWASPQPCTALSHAHEAIHATVGPAYCRPHYRPGAWVPHCTLGMRIGKDRADAARSFAVSFQGVIDVTFDVLDCVAVPSLAPVESRRLP
ncbi:2'-5' RNA ligase family protein [Bosea sp. (in: a-proteobacteria)]|uniref:2'-5' RNA ligase family protein n=1 Tax=Bosea sp. (in: a-proteobacteria) TaxID=1871050 RepID=UPI001AC739C3|nr:2'-5' RNA ligase family protein [Bosea sp. (in: a-proteobacteria)]MBN9442291.1 2'-5' RNA ligase family protein [Bosea sp. (in: a-proteobacteria)]